MNVNEEKLLLQILKEPDKGLKKAVSEYGNMVRAIVTRVLPQRQQDTEECIADTFVALWKNSHRLLSEDYPIKAWLAVSARNKAIDRYRTLKSKDMLPLDEDIAIETDDLTSDEAEDAIEEIIASLTEPDHEIFLRKYYLLEPSKEIAAALNMTEQSVNMRLSRGRERLKKELLHMGLHIRSGRDFNLATAKEGGKWYE